MALRTRGLLAAGAAALLLISGSQPRAVGDGREYLTQALNFASFHGPSLGRREIPVIEQQLTKADPRLASWDISKAGIRGPDSRLDFPHFWFYALLATPFVWLTEAAHANPILAFTGLNLALLGLALWVALPRLGASSTTLVFFSPLIWWIDKPHTEVFTVSLLAIALCVWRDRPGWALVASGMAAAQNPPIAAVFAAVGVLEIGRRGASVRHDRRFLMFASVGGAFLLLQPVYTYARHGTPSLLLTSTLRGVPTFAELTAVLADLNVGMLFAFPIFPLAVIVAAVIVGRHRAQSLRSPELLATGAIAALFLTAFASTVNVHHGATPGMSRYALWLIPLAIPLLRHAHDTKPPGWRVVIASLAILSAGCSVVLFHPARPENASEPTALARWLWTRHPSWSNPLPEVFAETVRHTDATHIPTAVANCAKILVAGDLRPQSVWPLPCYPAPLPAFCREPAVVCYANREQRIYSFVRAPGRAGPVTPDADAWPRSAEDQVRRWFDERDWWGLALPPEGLEVLRAAFNLMAFPLGSSSRFVLVLRPEAPLATLAFRLQAPMAGELLDPMSGTVVSAMHFDGPADELWSVDLPPGHEILLLDMHGVVAP